jgi:putative membrane protein
MPYSKINPDDMILRDHLAYDRTVLANERTLLSYLRTAIALLAAGGTLVKIFPDEASMVRLGVVLLALGAMAAYIGIWRFVAVKRKLSLTYRKLDEEQDPATSRSSA